MLLGYRRHARRAYFADFRAWYCWYTSIDLAPLAARRRRGGRWIGRTWRTALGLLEHDRYTDRFGIGKRWVLRAIAKAAMKTGSRYVAFGVSGPYPPRPG